MPMPTASRSLTALTAMALSIALATSALASPSASIEQVRNGKATDTTTPTPSWGTGNVGASNAHYLESHSTCYRAVMGDLPTDGTVIELIIGYNVKRSGSYAIDYLTHYQRLLPHVTFGHSNPEVFNPLAGVTGVPTTFTTAPIPLPTRNLVIDPDGAESEPAMSQPSTSMASLSAAEREMTLYGGNLIDVSYVTEGDVALATSSSQTQVKVRFTATSPKAVLAWGGHIACRWDWGFNSDGTPRSAGGISGSSYHMSLVTWNLGSLGSQDRSMSTDAVYPVPRCGITNAGPFCAGTTNTHAAPSGMESYAWSLFDNTSGATIVGSSTASSVTIHSGTGGSYGVMVTTGASGFTKPCQTTVTVNPLVTANAGPDQAVCATSPQVQLDGGVGGGATTGSWTGGTGTFTPGRTVLNPTYTPSAGEITAGTVLLTLNTPGIAPCPGASDTVRIVIQRAATAGAGADQIVCATSPLVQLAGSFGGSATSGSWSGGAGTFTPGPATPNATYLPSAEEIAAGTVNLTFTTDDPTGPCGAVSDQMTLTINPAATVNAGPDQTVCAVSPQLTLAGSVGGAATTGTWSGGAGTYSPGPTTLNATYTPSAAEITAGVVTLTLTTNDPAGPCGALSDQVQLTINRSATANAGADQTVCATSPLVQLGGSLGGAATSGSWSGGTGTFTPGPNALNATYLPSAAEIAGGGVTLTLTSDDPTGPCAAVGDQMQITINPAATVNAGPDQTVCTASPLAQLAGSIGGAAASANWSGGAGTYNPNASTLNATYTPSAAEIAGGGVTLTLSTNDPSGPCPVVTDQVRITINPVGTVNAGDDRVVCASSPQVQLWGSIGGAAGGATWSGGTGTFDPRPTAGNAIYTPSAAEIAAGSVTLTLTTNDPSGPCGAVSDQMTITINPVATVNAGPDQTVCATSPQVALAGAVGGAAASGSWTGGTGTFSPSRSVVNPTYTPSAAEIAAGSVTLTLGTNDPSGPCGAVTDQVRITINPAATVNAGPDQTLCASSPVAQLAGSIGGAAGSGTWSGGTGSYSPSASSPNATYTPSAAEIAAGSVTLTLTTSDPSGPCGAVTDQVRITINPVATVNAGADRVVCASNPQVQLWGSIGGGAGSATWSGGTGTFSPRPTAGNAIYTPSAAEIAAGSVTLTLTTNDPSGPCGAVSDQMTITIDPITIVNAGVDVTVCSSSPQVQLQGSVSGAVNSGSWTGGTGTFNPSRNVPNPTYTPSAAEIAAGSVTLRLVSAASSSPCPPANDALNIFISKAVAVNAGPDRTVCLASPQVQLAGSLGNGATSGTWSGGTGTYNPSPNVPNPTYTPSAAEIAAGGVTLTLTTNDPAGPCPAVNDQMRITIDAPQVTVPTRTLCSGITPVSLCANASGGVSPYAYRWSNGATTQCISVTDTARYTVTITDAIGCQATGIGFFRYRDCVGMLAHTSVTCDTYMDGTGQELLSTDVHYNLTNDIITSIAPGVFFYYTKITAPRADFTVQVVQTKDDAGFPYCPVLQGQVTQYDSNCSSVGEGTETSSGQVSIPVTGATVGKVYIVRVKYSLKELIGSYLNPSGGVHYNFYTEIDGKIVDADPDGLQLGVPKYAPPSPEGPGLPTGAGAGTKLQAGEIENGLEDGIDLYRAVPNPFSDGMRMAYAVSRAGEHVSISVYDLAGRKVRDLASGVYAAGRHIATWDGRDDQGQRMHQGVYFVHVRIGNDARQVRVTFLR